ncbi:hypothetical protein V2J09_017681 [Rumex salicifolius]
MSVPMERRKDVGGAEGKGAITYVIFIPTSSKSTTHEVAHLFFKNMVKLQGLSRSILFKLLGRDLHFSTTFHPQNDRKTEHINAILECYLRHYVSSNHKDWEKLIDIA